MSKPQVSDQRVFALAALEAAQGVSGEFIELKDEGDGAVSYLFTSKLKGYLDWRWSVTLYHAEGQEPTVSEIVLLPGENSLVAPDWVPWSERLADYKALQAELEAQAALDAEEAEGDDDEDESEDVDDNTKVIDLPEDMDEDLENEEQEALTTLPDLEEGEDSEQDAEDAGQRPPRSRGRNRRRYGKKKD